MWSKLVVLIIPLFLSCDQVKKFDSYIQNEEKVNRYTNDNPYRNVVDIPLPVGYSRVAYPAGSFSSWLRNIALKKDKRVFKFDGTLKVNQEAQFAVVDISVGDKDLQQCADAVMRLRAEYFYSLHQYSRIHFIDNNGRVYQFTQPYTRQAFNKYLELVFSMCGSASLEKQLSKHIVLPQVIPGDVLIHGGFPGHAEIVMDVATNKDGKIIYLLAQSYMPAQDIHILKNPTSFLSPWYQVSEDLDITTPEYTFSVNALKRW